MSPYTTPTEPTVRAQKCRLYKLSLAPLSAPWAVAYVCAMLASHMRFHCTAAYECGLILPHPDQNKAPNSLHSQQSLGLDEIEANSTKRVTTMRVLALCKKCASHLRLSHASPSVRARN